MIATEDLIQVEQHTPKPGKLTRALRAAGFMGTGAAVIRRSDDGLEGLILEKVNGMPLEKR